MIFKTLMTYRATPVSPLFVQALNLIDVEFSSDSKDEKEVRTAWKILLDHFSDLAKVVGGVSELTHERTADLLLVMGKCLGYEFDRVYLKKGGYYPQGLGNVEMEQHTLRRMLLDLLDGKRRLPIATFEQKFPDLVDRPQDDDGER